MKRFYFFTETIERGRILVSIRYKLDNDYFYERFYRDEITPEQQALISEYSTTGLDPIVINEIEEERGATR